MDQIIWLILRRMRQPLLVLIGVYSVAVLGMVLVPGIEQDGQKTHMDFFHAIYFVSYTSTTIGFGELPTTFSSSQRMWAMVCIYMSVIGWIYSIGAILTLIQDPTFRQALVERRFANSVRKIKEPFYLLCGYGEAGVALVQALTHYNIRVVVIDKNQDRINELSLHDQKFPVFVPGLCADAEIPQHMLEAGLKHPSCSRVIALTESDAINLKIAITSKLLNPKLKVIARSGHEGTKSNISSFGTENIVDAFEIFAETIALALHSPDHYLLREFLSGISGTHFDKPPVPPRGMWIVCGYGRFGRYLVNHLEDEHLPTVVIESNDQVEPPPHGMILGRGTEANTLIEAGIKGAAGIIAGTDNDPNNLSIIMTARELNPDLFIVARQNSEANAALFEALDANIVMNPGQVLAKNIRGLVTMPKLSEFLERVSQYDNEWARGLFNRLEKVVGTDIVPDIWVIKVTEDEGPSILKAISRGNEVRIEHLMIDPYQRSIDLKALPLLFARGEDLRLMPAKITTLRIDDRILFCGVGHTYQRMRLLANDDYLLEQILLDRDIPRSGVMRWVLGYKKDAQAEI